MLLIGARGVNLRCLCTVHASCNNRTEAVLMQHWARYTLDNLSLLLYKHLYQRTAFGHLCWIQPFTVPRVFERKALRKQDEKHAVPRICRFLFGCNEKLLPHAFETHCVPQL